MKRWPIRKTAAVSKHWIWTEYTFPCFSFADLTAIKYQNNSVLSQLHTHERSFIILFSLMFLKTYSKTWMHLIFHVYLNVLMKFIPNKINSTIFQTWRIRCRQSIVAEGTRVLSAQLCHRLLLWICTSHLAIGDGFSQPEHRIYHKLLQYKNGLKKPLSQSQLLRSNFLHYFPS